MTSYFDEREANAAKCIEHAIQTESAVIKDVQILIPHLPEKFKGKINKIIDDWEIEKNEKARRYYQISPRSRLLSDLHSLFHDIPSYRGAEAVCGALTHFSDKPDDMLLQLRKETTPYQIQRKTQ